MSHAASVSTGTAQRSPGVGDDTDAFGNGAELSGDGLRAVAGAAVEADGDREGSGAVYVVE
ncbi:hypothetical protein NDI56_05455 [Haloarcula sp. S1CR25-12]|uniref:Uncharacterized protein n=1 Tax=Haloarcula saliterrae TaxID=2950534 RepID=A0ABU2F972_9EURY|nr:hypothetical protein [Haloarcula sp. S1CR25-12]MDS0258838.1 hypothetical protein [Haloarcula sp. S1CR25-12]